VKDFINSATRAMINVGLGCIVTGALIWVIMLASNFKGFF
jgi:hypothetical protein